MARLLKKLLIATYEADLGGGKNVIVLDPGSMTVERTQEFRKDLREKGGGAKLRVVHNRTVSRVLNPLYAGKEKALEEVLSGPSALVIGGETLGPAAKVLRDWRKKHKTLKVKGGVADGDVLDAKSIDALADLPGLPQLRAMIAQAILGPARGLAVALQATYGGVARCVQAHVDKSPAAPEGASAETTSGGGTAGQPS